MASTTFPALRFKQRDHDLYLGHGTAADLERFTEIDRFDPALDLDDPAQGYQREPEQGRIRRLANYLITRDQGDGLLPTAVLLASRNPVNFVSTTNGFGSIVVDDDNPLLVVDGQTRILGLDHAISERGEIDLRSFEVPFVLLDDVDRLMEMIQFKIVNGEAKSVRTDLVNMILTELAKEKGDASIKGSDRWKVVAARVVELLNTSPGVWQDMIVMPNASAYSKAEVALRPELEHRRLARATSFMTSVKPVYDWLRGNYFSVTTLEDEAHELAEIVGAYWEAIAALLPTAFGDRNEYVIQKTPGIFALHMALAKPVLRDMYKAHRPFTETDFKVMLDPVPELNDPDFWHTRARRASSYGSMRGFAELADLLRVSL